MTKPYDPSTGKKPSKAQIRQAEKESVGCEKVRLLGPLPLSYLASIADAEERMKRGEKQTRCASCQRYRWPDESSVCRNFCSE